MLGFVHMIEAIVAGIMLMVFLVTMTSGVLVEPQPKDLSGQAFSLLHGLDRQGLLREPANSQDYGTIDFNVRYFSYNHTVEVCDYTGSCQGVKPNVRNRWVGTYILAGSGTYKPMEVRLYLFEV